MMKERKKQHVYNPCHGWEQLILTQQFRILLCFCGPCQNGDREAQHSTFGGCRGCEVLSDLLCVKHSLISQQFTSGFVDSLCTFCTVTGGHIGQGDTCFVDTQHTHTEHCKPDRLAIFHTATVTGSQNTWVICSLLAAQSQAGCFPNNVETLISPYRAHSKTGKILLEWWEGTPDTTKRLKAISRNHPPKILLLLQSWHSNFTFSHCLHITSPVSTAIYPFYLVQISTTLFQRAQCFCFSSG